MPATTSRSRLRVLSGSRSVPRIEGNNHGPCESVCRLRRSAISQPGGVIVLMPASDLVCGWTMRPCPGTRTTVPSIAIVPAISSTRVQSSASNSPMRHPSPDKTSTRSRRS